jgi:6-phosphogluconate dehydrogenase
MVHNGIEYGMMTAYAGGLGILRDANTGKQKNESDAETTPLREPENYQAAELARPKMLPFSSARASCGHWASRTQTR